MIDFLLTVFGVLAVLFIVVPIAAFYILLFLPMRIEGPVEPRPRAWPATHGWPADGSDA